MEWFSLIIQVYADKETHGIISPTANLTGMLQDYANITADGSM